MERAIVLSHDPFHRELETENFEWFRRYPMIFRHCVTLVDRYDLGTYGWIVLPRFNKLIDYLIEHNTYVIFYRHEASTKAGRMS